AMANSGITSEKVRKSNIGIDALLFNNRISLTADAFYERASGIIVQLNRLPAMLGTSSAPTGNAGIVDNKGFELNLAYRNNIGDLRYALSGNYSLARNKIIDMQEQEYTSSFNYRTGYPIGSQFGLQALGFFNDD